MRRQVLLASLLTLAVTPAAASAATITESVPLPGGVTEPSFAVPYPGSSDVLVADWATDKIWRLPSTPFAGNGNEVGPLGDGGAPLSASLASPSAMAFRRDGGLLVADTDHHRIRLIKGGVVTTVAGSGEDDDGGDGGPATDADLLHPTGVAVLPDGESFLIADSANHRIRRVDGDTGVIQTIAGNGTDAEVDGPPLAASFSFPQALAVSANGKKLYVVDRVGRTLRKIHLDSNGDVATLAGPASGDTTPANPWDHVPPTGTFAHDDSALTAGFSPMGLLVLADDSFIVFDAGNDRVRRIKNGDVETIVGTGVRGDGPDGLDALATDLNSPVGGYVNADKDLVVVDAGNRKLRTIKGLQLPSVVKDPPAKVDPLPAEPVTPPAEPLLPVPLAPVPAPQMGKSVGVKPGSGVVRFRRAGGRSFTLLTEGASVPVGSVLDTREGSVTLSSATGGGKVQSASFSNGMFEVRQKPGSAVTDLHLRGTLTGCPKASSKPTARAAGKKRPTRRLWGDGKGKFRTHGSSAVATVRGTKWLTEDRCDGTLVKVQRGVVDVTPVRGGKTVKVRAGGQRFVRQRRAR